MAATNEIRRSEKFILACLAAVLGMLFWVSWQVREPEQPDGPVLSGVKVKAFVHSNDGLPPKEATVEVYVDDTEAEWLLRLQEAVKGLEKFP